MGKENHMTHSTTYSAQWHLAHSQPSVLLDYFNPTRGFIPQINLLFSRFKAVQTLCESGDGEETLIRLRNELAFHLVKMSRWWGFDFCPRGLTGVRNPLFLTFVKAHIARVIDDECFFDLFTMQRQMHSGDTGHILILGKDQFISSARTILYGVDGGKGFRFANKVQNSDPEWHRYSYPDFASAWLAAWSTHCSGTNVCKNLREHLAAEREHACARTWHQRYFHHQDARNAIKNHGEAQAQLSICQSPFGRAEFETIVNSLAYDIVKAAFDRSLTIADLIEENGDADGTLRTANGIKQQARQHVANNVDPCHRPDMEHLLDRTLSYIPRRCA